MSAIAFAVLLGLFMCIINGICGIGTVGEFNKIGRRMIGRYLGLSIIYSGLGVLVFSFVYHLRLGIVSGKESGFSVRHGSGHSLAGASCPVCHAPQCIRSACLGGGMACLSVLFTYQGIPVEGLPVAVTIGILMDFFLTGARVGILQMELAFQAHTYGMLDVEMLRKA